MPPTFTLALIGAAISGAAGFGLAWRLQSATINEMELQSANTRIAAAYVARKAIERSTTAVIVAQNAATDRMVVLHRDADLARSGLDGLRESTDRAMRAATADLATCRSVVAAHGVVLAESSGTIQEVARDADQCFSDLQTMTEAWPK